MTRQGGLQRGKYGHLLYATLHSSPSFGKSFTDLSSYNLTLRHCYVLAKLCNTAT